MRLLRRDSLKARISCGTLSLVEGGRCSRCSLNASRAPSDTISESVPDDPAGMRIGIVWVRSSPRYDRVTT